MPEFVLNITTSNETVKANYCKVTETDPSDEGLADKLKEFEEKDAAVRPKVLEEFEKHPARCKVLSVSTDTS